MIIGNNRITQTVKQTSILKMLYKLRDYIARIEDESTDYVMPKHLMFQIAKNMPNTKSELRDCCRNMMPSPVFLY